MCMEGVEYACYSVQNDRKSRSGYKRHAIGVGGTLGGLSSMAREELAYMNVKSFPAP